MPSLTVTQRFETLRVTGGRFRQGTMLLRWPPIKAPPQCAGEQISESRRPGKLVKANL